MTMIPMLLIVSFLTVIVVDAYSNGAPNGDACRTLYPGHGVDKQYGRSTYRIQATPMNTNDSKILVQLYSTTETFLGFIMQARLHSDREMLVNGQFQSNDLAQSLDCLGGYQNTLTHTNAYPKYKIETIWTPPKNFLSDIVFRVTVVQSKNAFWTAIDSDLLEINPSISQASLINYNPGGSSSGSGGGGGINNFNIHNNHLDPPPSTPNVPSGFVVNKDLLLNHPPLPPSNQMDHPSTTSIITHQPLVQSYPISTKPLMMMIDPTGSTTTTGLSSHGSNNMDNLIAYYFLDYNICSRKLCFGLPYGCLRKRNCLMLLTAQYVPYTDSTVEFEIIADHKSAMSSKRMAGNSFGSHNHNNNNIESASLPSAYYSMAFSSDKFMGNDSVTDCLVYQNRPQLMHSINLDRSKNEQLSEDEFTGVQKLNLTYNNGIVYCKWRKRRRFTLRGQRFDLREQKYFIMMAFGRLAGFNNKRKEPHLDKIVSESLVDFKLTGSILAYSKMFLIKFHASFMIAAWIGFVSIGIITARYLKPLWLSHSLFGVRIWFAIHRSSMLMALIFICMGTISIFLYVDGFSFGFHQMFGFLAIICAVCNPIGAVFRPDCESSKRWIFNWIHWFIGNLGYCSAIAALFFVIQFQQTLTNSSSTIIKLQQPFLWSIAFYLFFNLTVHSLLQLYFCNCHHTKDTGDISGDGSIPSTTNTSQRIDSLSDTSFLRYFFILYLTVITIFVIVIISFTLIN